MSRARCCANSRGIPLGVVQNEGTLKKNENADQRSQQCKSLRKTKKGRPHKSDGQLGSVEGELVVRIDSVDRDLRRLD